MNIYKNKIHQLFPIFFSILGHFLLFLFINFVVKQSKPDKYQNTLNNKQRKSRFYIKTVGKRKSQQKNFSTNYQLIQVPSFNKQEIGPQKNNNEKRKLTLKDLGKQNLKLTKNGFQIKKENFKESPKQKDIKNKLLDKIGIDGEAKEIIKSTGLNFKFLAPQGVDESELNSIEKKFYAFQKRTYHTYISSFLREYNRIITQKPYLKNKLINESHHMTGRINFDSNGDILSIKMIKWSIEDNLQDLFEKTLKGIRSIPNPPKALIKKNEELIIFFQLNIN